LHLLDQVKGASHFMTTQSSNQKIHQELQQQLPGYLVPKMVKEIAGKANKTPFYETCK
jgi:L-lysine 2,3-aminomutase